MSSNILTCIYSTFIVMLLVIIGNSSAKPWAENLNPLDQPTFLDTASKSCTSETENICQRCAKQTKSPVVYPWCCTNHEESREWCKKYLDYGLQGYPRRITRLHSHHGNAGSILHGLRFDP